MANVSLNCPVCGSLMEHGESKLALSCPACGAAVTLKGPKNPIIYEHLNYANALRLDQNFDGAVDAMADIYATNVGKSDAEVSFWLALAKYGVLLTVDENGMLQPDCKREIEGSVVEDIICRRVITYCADEARDEYTRILKSVSRQQKALAKPPVVVVPEPEIVEEPVYEEPVAEESIYEESAPAYEEVAVYDVPVEEPVYEEPVYEEPVAYEEVSEYQAPVEEQYEVYEEPVAEPVYEEAAVYDAPAEEVYEEEPVYEEQPVCEQADVYQEAPADPYAEQMYYGEEQYAQQPMYDDGQQMYYAEEQQYVQQEPIYYVEPMTGTFDITRSGVLKAYIGTDRVVTVDPGVKVIGKNAFRDNDDVREVRLPEGITEIGEFAFTNCTSLETIYLPETVETISKYAFSGCTKIKQIYLPVSVHQVGKHAFARWTKEQNIVNPQPQAKWHKEWHDYCDAKITLTPIQQ